MMNGIFKNINVILYVLFFLNLLFDIAEHPNVVSVLLNRGRKLHTTHSWEFMSMEHNGVALSHSLFRKARYGEDVILVK